jgi:hypothetical protein
VKPTGFLPIRIGLNHYSGNAGSARPDVSFCPAVSGAFGCITEDIRLQMALASSHQEGKFAHAGPGAWALGMDGHEERRFARHGFQAGFEWPVGGGICRNAWGGLVTEQEGEPKHHQTQPNGTNESAEKPGANLTVTSHWSKNQRT